MSTNDTTDEMVQNMSTGGDYPLATTSGFMNLTFVSASAFTDPKAEIRYREILSTESDASISTDDGKKLFTVPQEKARINTVNNVNMSSVWVIELPIREEYDLELSNLFLIDLFLLVISLFPGYYLSWIANDVLCCVIHVIHVMCLIPVLKHVSAEIALRVVKHVYPCSQTYK